MNGWNFKRFIIVLVGSLWMLPTTAQEPSFVPFTDIQLGQNICLDQREHRGTKDWNGLFPHTH